jgi:hypothetical protein
MDARVLLTPFLKYLDLADATERHIFYQKAFVESMTEAYGAE